MITPELLDMLQEQKDIEHFNMRFYLACSWALLAARPKRDGFASKMRKWSNEEQGHSDLICLHIVDRAGPDNDWRPDFGDAPSPLIPTGNEPLPYFEAAYKAETQNTARLIDLMDNAEEAGDKQLQEFLRPLIIEQTKSMAEVTDIVLALRAAGANEAALLSLDEKYGE